MIFGGFAHALTVTTAGLFQVPLPNSVFVNTTESCEVERLVHGASGPCCDERSLVSLLTSVLGRPRLRPVAWARKCGSDGSEWGFVVVAAFLSLSAL